MIPASLRQLLDATTGARRTRWAGRDVWLARAPWGELALSLQGAQVLHWKAATTAGEGWLWVTPTPQALPGAIRGGIPLCWPWFAEEHTADESPDRSGPSHGPARTADWQIDTVVSDDGGVQLELSPRKGLHSQLTPRAVIQACTQHLQVQLITTNQGHAPATLTKALHTYLAVAGASGCRVSGLAGSRYLDKHRDFAACSQLDDLTIAGALDRIYAVHHPVVLDDGDRRLHIAKAGSGSTVVWHPGDALPGDTPPEAGQRFLCIEAACTHLDPILLEPGARHHLSTTLTPEVAP